MKSISPRKKAVLIILPIVVILIAIITGVVITRNNKIKEENKIVETVEYLTKKQLVRYQCEGKLYQSAFEDLHPKINDESVSSKGYVGDGAGPSTWEWYIQNQIEALDYLLKKGDNMLFYECYSSLPSVNDSLGTQLYHDLDGFIETWKNTRIILSKRSSIATEGGIKMWRYTELNSGVEFTACLYRDNTIEIGMTDEGASRAYSLYVEQYENAFMDELDKFNQIVEKKKEKAEYEADVITSMLGAALFGALF